MDDEGRQHIKSGAGGLYRLDQYQRCRLVLKGMDEPHALWFQLLCSHQRDQLRRPGGRKDEKISSPVFQKRAQLEPQLHARRLVLSRRLPPADRALPAGAEFRIGGIGDDNVEGLRRQGTLQHTDVPFDEGDVPGKAVRFNIPLAEVRQVRLYLYGTELRLRKLPREEHGDDSRACSGLEDPVTGLGAAEVGQEDAVEGEAVAFPGLDNMHNTGAAERDAVVGQCSHRSLSAISFGIRLGLPSAPTQTAFALQSAMSLPEVFSVMVCSNMMDAAVISEIHVSTTIVSP